jgi:hypothetical protein
VKADQNFVDDGTQDSPQVRSQDRDVEPVVGCAEVGKQIFKFRFLI